MFKVPLRWNAAMHCRQCCKSVIPLLWDYHVVLLWHAAPDARYILDFDTTLAFCTPIADYFRQAFLDESPGKAKVCTAISGHA